MLKSLALSGSHIDEWIRIWMTRNSDTLLSACASEDVLRLRKLHLEGTGSVSQLLSHTSVLFIHGLVYVNSAAKVDLKKVDLAFHD